MTLDPTDFNHPNLNPTERQMLAGMLASGDETQMHCARLMAAIVPAWREWRCRQPASNTATVLKAHAHLIGHMIAEISMAVQVQTRGNIRAGEYGRELLVCSARNADAMLHLVENGTIDVFDPDLPVDFRDMMRTKPDAGPDAGKGGAA